MPASDLLARLRDSSDDGPTARLAALLVDDALARPVSELVDASALVASVRDVVLAFAASDGGAASVVARVDAARGMVGATAGPVGDLLPPAAREGLRSLAALPLVARRDAVLRLLDRPTLRLLLRAQIVRTLSEFGRKAASPVADSSLARGLGGLGKLAGQIARPGPLGALASAVSGEVERQVEKRATEFADTAVAGVLAGIADQVSDPDRAADQAALRQELLEGLLAITGPELASLFERGAKEPVAIAVKTAAALGADDAVAAQAHALVTGLVALEGQRPLGELLAELGIRDAIARHATAYVRGALGRVLASAAFAKWLEELGA